MNAMKYAVVIEERATSFGAHVPDRPAYIAVGETREEALRLIQEAIELHLRSLVESGEKIQPPFSSIEYVHVAA
jgi:predicted RNase H-like HicB family nuclease